MSFLILGVSLHFNVSGGVVISVPGILVDRGCIVCVFMLVKLFTLRTLLSLYA